MWLQIKLRINNANTFTTSASISGVTDITTLTVSNASGGAERESIESIKFNAPLDYAKSQGRAVTVNDYKSIVPKVYANAKSVQVYGGEDNDVPVYGRVYISIVPTTGSITETQNQIVSDLKNTYSIASVTPIIIDPEYIKLRLGVNFVYNSKNTIKPKETLESNVLTTITNLIQIILENLIVHLDILHLQV